MKIECTCGARHAFEVTREMAERPVRYICPQCGLDASVFVDALVRRELGQVNSPAGEPIVIGMGDAFPQQPAEQPIPAPAAPVAVFQETKCLKHPGELATEKCRVCGKGICRKCMELFGYVCSPLCKAQAAARGIAVPVYGKQRALVEARRWRRIKWIGSATFLVLIFWAAFWFWYAWIGSRPKPVFSLRFPEAASFGQAVFAGSRRDQLVFIHETTLARYDLNTGTKVWSVDLLDREAIRASVERQRQVNQQLLDRANNEGAEDPPRFPSVEDLNQQMQRQFAAGLVLLVRRENIWVATPSSLSLFDWSSGARSRQLPVKGDSGGVICRGDEALMVDREGDTLVATRVELLSGEVKKELLSAGGERGRLAANTNTLRTPQTAATGASAGLPGRAQGGDPGPINPAKVAGQVQGLPLAARLALPATLANALRQERTAAALDEKAPTVAAASPAVSGSLSLLASKSGPVWMDVRLLEARTVSRSAMKPDSGKPVLEGGVTAGKSAQLSGELLNELQRSRGGDVVTEDASRYELTVWRQGAKQPWKGEVVGYPRLFPLESVVVLCGNENLYVLDNGNNKLWEARLAYPVRHLEALDKTSGVYGQGPCIEHARTLFVMDEGVLTAFDLSSGSVQWRLPTVGLAGLFFDDRGNLIVNSTTASPDSIKYSRQVDLSKRVVSSVLKVNSRNGNVLWQTQPGGMVTHVYGKYIFATHAFQPEQQDEGNPYRVETGFEEKPFLHIRRLNSRNGAELWDHVQERAPLDIGFEENRIRLVFKKEVQVLKFLDW